MKLRRAATTAFTLLVLLGHHASAQDTSQKSAVRVLVSNGLKAAMEELQPQAERAIERPLAVQYNSTLSVKKKIEAGEIFDATLITTEAVADLIKEGKLAAGSRTELARSELGIGIKAGAPKPDIHTVDAFKRALREAKVITYPQDGASRGYIDMMFVRLGVAADVKPKIVLAPGSGPATESVAAGKATFVITLFSEIVPIPGVEILGPLPGEYQSDIKFAAGVSSTAKNAEAGKALIAFLKSPKAAAVLKAKGLEPR
jgi:molybdate transport system substrate-binding protein